MQEFSDGYGPFPPTENADSDGLLAIGATLSFDRLIHAYQNGIFPWYNEDDPIYWFSPHERFVLFPQKLKVSKSMQTFLRNHPYRISTNEAFREVMIHCAQTKRKDQDGTWIHKEMINAYHELHLKGWAHSVEVWDKDKLVGGLYGVMIGQVFCGESMFSLQPNTSKLALIHLCQNENIKLIDCQVYTPHLESMGAESISRKKFLEFLQ